MLAVAKFFGWTLPEVKALSLVEYQHAEKFIESSSRQ